MKLFMALIITGQHHLIFHFFKQKPHILNILREIKTEKGIHSPFNSENPKDLERDKAINPTKYLKK